MNIIKPVKKRDDISGFSFREYNKYRVYTKQRVESVHHHVN